MESSWVEVAIAFGLVSSLLLSIEVGFRVGRHRRAKATIQTHLGNVQGAMLGLLGLLLGFSFAGATSRFIERQDIMVKEANAVGTAYLRADLLGEPHQGELKKELREYVAARVRLHESGVTDQSDASVLRLEAIQGRMWSAASAGAEAKPAVMLSVLPPVNDVIDLLAVRNAAAARHLPGLVLWLLISCAIATTSTIGFSSGLVGERTRFIPTVFGVLVATALWVTIDLDHPSRGLIRLDPAPLWSVQRAVGN